MCGRLCMADNKHRPLVGLTRQSYKGNTIIQIVLETIWDEIDLHSMDVSSKIAYQCLKLDLMNDSSIYGDYEVFGGSLGREKDVVSVSPYGPDGSLDYRIENTREFLAINNFDETLVVGKGRSGKVYKGNVSNGSSLVVAAIKRMDSTYNQGADELWSEVEMLSTFRHCNIASLIGYCNQGEEMILVYEYIPNGSLYDHLHKLVTPLSWLQRLNICIHAGHGLHYLQTGIEVGVIHRDIKSSNVLLDESWTAKIADLGLAMIVPRNQTYIESDAIKGTFGYSDPDYCYTGKQTRKSDVYASGVVLFEVLSTQSLKEFVRTAEACLHGDPEQRPTMATNIKTSTQKNI
ncbi:receptor-like protein kinase FERONIA [Tanacetum coccineum]